MGGFGISTILNLKGNLKISVLQSWDCFVVISTSMLDFTMAFLLRYSPQLSLCYDS